MRKHSHFKFHHCVTFYFPSTLLNLAEINLKHHNDEKNRRITHFII